GRSSASRPPDGQESIRGGAVSPMASPRSWSGVRSRPAHTGEPSMKNLLFLPGLLEDADGFAPLIARMKGAHAESVVADLTRHGTMAELAASALEQAPDGPLWIAGHSMGGYVALEMVRQAPERVAGLALMNTHARPDSPESTENRRRLMKLAETDFPAVNAALLPKLMTPAHLKDPV